MGSANPHGDWANPHSGADWRIPPRKIGGFANTRKYLLFPAIYPILDKRMDADNYPRVALPTIYLVRTV
jgi:hypothetical protein